ncbi:hypothetical protein B0H13DRAFT_1900500 [Mycena leptocephala]|nr:hypothetical protein B0H13DRAFT_1900500 [Mycena leptocephala]
MGIKAIGQDVNVPERVINHSARYSEKTPTIGMISTTTKIHAHHVQRPDLRSERCGREMMQTKKEVTYTITGRMWKDKWIGTQEKTKPLAPSACAMRWSEIGTSGGHDGYQKSAQDVHASILGSGIAAFAGAQSCVDSKVPRPRQVESEAEDLRPERVDDAGSREEMTRKNNRKEEPWWKELRKLEVLGGYKEDAGQERDPREEKTEDRCIALARRLGSPHIGSGDNGPSETSSFPRIRRLWTTHYSTTSAPSNPPTAAAASTPGRLVDAPGADELGGAITLPKVEPDADLDADEPETDDEGIDEAKGRLVWVATAVWNCFTRAWWRLRRDRKEKV